MYYEGIDSTNLILYLLRMEPGYVLLMYLSKILGIGFWEFAIFFKCVSVSYTHLRAHET